MQYLKNNKKNGNQKKKWIIKWTENFEPEVQTDCRSLLQWTNNQQIKSKTNDENWINDVLHKTNFPCVINKVF